MPDSQQEKRLRGILIHVFRASFFQIVPLNDHVALLTCHIRSPESRTMIACATRNSPRARRLFACIGGGGGEHVRRKTDRVSRYSAERSATPQSHSYITSWFWLDHREQWQRRRKIGREREEIKEREKRISLAQRILQRMVIRAPAEEAALMNYSWNGLMEYHTKLKLFVLSVELSVYYFFVHAFIISTNFLYYKVWIIYIIMYILTARIAKWYSF